MEQGQKKIVICLLVMVCLAVAAGVIYYYGADKNSDSFQDEGTLVRTDGDFIS